MRLTVGVVTRLTVRPLSGLVVPVDTQAKRRCTMHYAVQESPSYIAQQHHARSEKADGYSAIFLLILLTYYSLIYGIGSYKNIPRLVFARGR